MGNRVFPPRQASVGFPLAHWTRDGDLSHSGCLPHFDGLFRLAEEMLDGGELVGRYCECLGAEGVADEEAEILLCMRGFGTRDTKGTRGIPSRGAQRNVRSQDNRVSGSGWNINYAGAAGLPSGTTRGGREVNTPSVKGEHLSLQTRFTAHTRRLR